MKKEISNNTEMSFSIQLSLHAFQMAAATDRRVEASSAKRNRNKNKVAASTDQAIKTPKGVSDLKALSNSVVNTRKRLPVTVAFRKAILIRW